jgi:hypothetical protein
MGGSGEGDGGGNDPMAPWLSCAIYVMCLHRKTMIMYCCEHNELSWYIYIYI